MMNELTNEKYKDASDNNSLIRKNYLIVIVKIIINNGILKHIILPIVVF